MKKKDKWAMGFWIYMYASLVDIYTYTHDVYKCRLYMNIR